MQSLPKTIGYRLELGIKFIYNVTCKTPEGFSYFTMNQYKNKLVLHLYIKAENE